MNIKSIHCIVKGRVQGVGFRYYVMRQAQLCGVYGYVRNLSNGSVEIAAEGNSDAIQVFMNEVRKGPSNARVEECLISEAEPRGYINFEIR